MKNKTILKQKEFTTKLKKNGPTLKLNSFRFAPGYENYAILDVGFQWSLNPTA